ncbi:hypothetical protein EVAR_20950_1 [Eumeta japonica]|uniref:Integrase catalytic domain-containing protein n=1 Tax=Eumeta variegata TaxID=151549 RepID=A0A4C1V5G6_EUMVA|nr:hypothetical protein EVAR_20950_1 [Eumeta japonica]
MTEETPRTTVTSMPGETFRVGLRVPPFDPDDPTLWFAQIEETGKYDKLKTELVKWLSVSQERKIKQLLMHEELGDRKPSQFLRHLKSLAGPTVLEDFLRTIWSSRLATNLKTSGFADEHATGFGTTFDVLNKQVAALTRKLEEVYIEIRKPRLHRSRSNARSSNTHFRQKTRSCFRPKKHPYFDGRNQRLIDGATALSVNAPAQNSSKGKSSVRTNREESRYHCILGDFTEITSPAGKPVISRHTTVHHIRTIPGPVIGRPRRLDPKRLQIAKKEFENMLREGTTCKSESPWSSPLHLAPKKLGLRHQYTLHNRKRQHRSRESLFRIEDITKPFDYQSLAQKQQTDTELHEYLYKKIRYCLTIVDRYTHWSEAYPLQEITAEACAAKFVSGWVARFGCPEHITTDRGRQFNTNFSSGSLLCSEYHTTPPRLSIPQTTGW